MILLLDTGSRPVLNSPPDNECEGSENKIVEGEGGGAFPYIRKYATIRWLPYIRYYTVAVYFYRKCVGKTGLISVISNLLLSSYMF